MTDASPDTAPAGGIAIAPVRGLTPGQRAGRPDGTGQRLLDVQDLRVYFQLSGGFFGFRKGGTVKAVDGVTFSVDRGETLGLVGESGCGKTSIAKAILQLVAIAGGRIALDGVQLGGLRGRELRQMRRRLQMIFQDPYSSLNPRLSVEGILTEPLEVHGIGSRSERRERMAELLRLVGMNPNVAKRLPHQFSGGQRQRIGIARALALHPDLIVADEPISALDVSVQAQVTNLLQELQERLGLTYLYIAHDLAVVRHISHRVAVMYLGRIVEIGPTDVIFEQPVHPYTVALLSAVPIPDPEVEGRRRRIILSGDVPSSANPPSGCRFHTRCWLRQKLGNPELCAREDPQLVTVSGADGSPLTTGAEVADATAHSVACHFSPEAAASPERASTLGSGAGR